MRFFAHHDTNTLPYPFINLLTYWRWDKTAYSNSFSSMKIVVVLWLKFRFNIFPIIQLTITIGLNWFRYWQGAHRATSHYLSKWSPRFVTHIHMHASLIELTEDVYIHLKLTGPLLLTWFKLAEWRNGSVSALPCERPGFDSRTRLREIIPANNCTMQGQNNWGNWGSPGVMKLWVAWEVLRWLMKFRELCNGGFHPKLVTPPYHGFLNVNTPPNSQNSKRH